MRTPLPSSRLKSSPEARLPFLLGLSASLFTLEGTCYIILAGLRIHCVDQADLKRATCLCLQGAVLKAAGRCVVVMCLSSLPDLPLTLIAASSLYLTMLGGGMPTTAPASQCLDLNTGPVPLPCCLSLPLLWVRIFTVTDFTPILFCYFACFFMLCEGCEGMGEDLASCMNVDTTYTQKKKIIFEE